MTKWIRLQHICEKLAKKTIHIHSSTDMTDDHVAATEFNNNEVNIILNMKRTKSTTMVIKAIAHEMVHVLEGTSDHNVDFDEKWSKLESKITEEYNK